MRRADIAFGAVIAAIGAGAFALAFAMPFFSENSPGPGFFPRFVAAGLILLGSLQVAAGFRPPRAEVRPVGPVSELERITHGKAAPRAPDQAFFAARPLIVIAAYILAVPLLGVLGFVPTVALLLAFLFLFVERRRGIAPWVGVVVIPMLTWLLFARLLGMEVPMGLLHAGVLGL